VDASLGLPILIFLIAVALLFDFLNGLHDAANSIATIVSTRVLRPQYAVLWAAFFNFIAFLFFGLHVANTIGKGIIEPDVVDAAVIFAALIGAIVWNLITWGLGIPSSSSHALIGGLVGAGMAKAGISAAVWSGLSKTLLAIVLSPLVGFLLALLLVAIVSGCRCARRRLRSTARSASCNSSRPRSIRSAMAATTRKRPWVSSRCSCIRRATSGRISRFPSGS
jgi:PiT family inorganic phosphate transporter